MNGQTTRFCSSCGTANPVSARYCLACRQALPQGTELPAGAARAGGAGDRERAWSTGGDPAGQETTPAGVYGGRFEPPAYVIRQQAFDQPGYAPYPPAAGQAAPPPPANRRSSGGCVMGLIAVGLICVLTAVLAGLVVGRPMLEDALGGELERAVATEFVRELDASVNSRGVAPGTFVIRADEINEELAANPDRYEPIKHPTVTIDEDGFEIRFEVYGLESGYRGMVEADRGVIVLTDVEADGAAGQLLSPGEVREIVENELNAYFARTNVEVERVELSDGELTVVTAGAASRGGTARPTRTPATGDDGDAPTPTPGGFFRPPRTPTPEGDEA